MNNNGQSSELNLPPQTQPQQTSDTLVTSPTTTTTPPLPGPISTHPLPNETTTAAPKREKKINIDDSENKILEEKKPGIKSSDQQKSTTEAKEGKQEKEEKYSAIEISEQKFLSPTNRPTISAQDALDIVELCLNTEAKDLDKQLSKLLDQYQKNRSGPEIDYISALSDFIQLNLRGKQVLLHALEGSRAHAVHWIKFEYAKFFPIQYSQVNLIFFRENSNQPVGVLVARQKDWLIEITSKSVSNEHKVVSEDIIRFAGETIANCQINPKGPKTLKLMTSFGIGKEQLSQILSELHQSGLLPELGTRRYVKWIEIIKTLLPHADSGEIISQTVPINFKNQGPIVNYSAFALALANEREDLAYMILDFAGKHGKPDQIHEWQLKKSNTYWSPVGLAIEIENANLLSWLKKQGAELNLKPCVGYVDAEDETEYLPLTLALSRSVVPADAGAMGESKLTFKPNPVIVPLCQEVSINTSLMQLITSRFPLPFLIQAIIYLKHEIAKIPNFNYDINLNRLFDVGDSTYRSGFYELLIRECGSEIRIPNSDFPELIHEMPVSLRLMQQQGLVDVDAFHQTVQINPLQSIYTTPIFFAITTNNLNLFRFFIEQMQVAPNSSCVRWYEKESPDSNQKPRLIKKEKPLQVAIKNQAFDVINYLIELEDEKISNMEAKLGGIKKLQTHAGKTVNVESELNKLKDDKRKSGLKLAVAAYPEAKIVQSMPETRKQELLERQFAALRIIGYWSLPLDSKGKTHKIDKQPIVKLARVVHEVETSLSQTIFGRPQQILPGAVVNDILEYLIENEKEANTSCSIS